MNSTSGLASFAFCTNGAKSGLLLGKRIVPTTCPPASAKPRVNAASASWPGMKSLTAVSAFFQPCPADHLPSGSAVCHWVNETRATYGEIRGIATPAALVRISGTRASSVSGAIAAAIGEPTRPSRRLTFRG